MSDIESLILGYLSSTQSRAYTRSMYVALAIKSRGVSLNKFRATLNSLCQRGLIVSIPAGNTGYSAWGKPTSKE